MPLNSLEELQDLVRQDAWHLATRRCRDSVRRLNLHPQEVQQLLLLIQTRDFRKEYGLTECDLGEVIADDYLLWYDDVQGTRCAPNKGLLLYIKLGVHTNSDGSCCAVISLHPST
jgi:hypothetical protein